MLQPYKVHTAAKEPSSIRPTVDSGVKALFSDLSQSEPSLVDISPSQDQLLVEPLEQARPKNSGSETGASETQSLWSRMIDLFSPLASLQEPGQNQGVLNQDIVRHKTHIRIPRQLPLSVSKTSAQKAPAPTRGHVNTYETDKNPEALSESLRYTMRSLPASIVVLTTTDDSGIAVNDPESPKPTPLDRTRAFRGMTISSFTTLTLSPHPHITFNIRSTDSQPSRTFKALCKCGYFLIHLLDSTAAGASIADLFTKGNRDGLFHLGEKTGLFTLEEHVVRSFSSLEEELEEVKKLPVLHGPGVMKVLLCSIDLGTSQDNQSGTISAQPMFRRIISIGDHFQVIGRVHEVLHVPFVRDKNAAALGLIYVDGKYRAVGKVIDLQGGK